MGKKMFLLYLFKIILSNWGCCQVTLYSYDSQGRLLNKNEIGALSSANLVGREEICFNESTTLRVEGGIGYQWSTGSTNQKISLSPQIGKVYSVTITGENGCTRVLSRDYSIHPLPTTSNISGNASPSTEGRHLYSVRNTPGSFYHWFAEGGLFQSGYGTSEVVVDWGGASTGVIGVVETSEFGCTGDTVLLNIEIQTTTTQQVELAAGWNIISTYLALEDYAIETVFDHLNPNLVKIKNIAEFYDPNLSSTSNTLIEMEDGAGYWVNVNTPDVAIFQGAPLNPGTTPISLEKGWNLIGYLSNSSQNVENALAPILSVLEKVKDIYNSYDPSLDPTFNTLNRLEPGRGYWVKVSQAAMLTYPDFSGEMIAKSSPVPVNQDQLMKASKWKVKAYSNSTVAYGKVKLNGQPVLDGGMIGAFVNGECRAIGEVRVKDGESYTSLVINGIEKESIEFRLLHGNKTHVSSFVLSSIPGKPVPGFMPLNFGDMDVQDESVESAYLEIFPNPFSNEFSLSLDLVKPTDVNIYVFSITGKLIDTVQKKDQPKGLFSFNWVKNQRAKGISPGVYLVKIETDSNQYYKQIIHH